MQVVDVNKALTRPNARLDDRIVQRLRFVLRSDVKVFIDHARCFGKVYRVLVGLLLFVGFDALLALVDTGVDAGLLGSILTAAGVASFVWKLGLA
jgi:hypothetical protein